MYQISDDELFSVILTVMVIQTKYFEFHLSFAMSVSISVSIGIRFCGGIFGLCILAFDFLFRRKKNNNKFVQSEQINMLFSVTRLSKGN